MYTLPRLLPRFTLLTFALAACSPPPAVKPAANVPDHDLVAAIRAAGEQSGSAVEVQPLRDPAIDGFLRQAQALEREGRIADARAQIERALKLAPDAPDLLQYQAELLITEQRYTEAEPLARRSYEVGPKLGSLCARNWQTIVELRGLAQDPASVESAKVQLAGCKVPAPVRM